MWGLSCGYRVRFDNSDEIVRLRAGLLFTQQLPNNMRIASRMSGEESYKYSEYCMTINLPILQFINKQANNVNCHFNSLGMYNLNRETRQISLSTYYKIGMLVTAQRATLWSIIPIRHQGWFLADPHAILQSQQHDANHLLPSVYK